MNREAWIQEQLEDIDRQGLRRSLRTRPSTRGSWVDERGQRILNLAANDYLDLAHHPAVVEAAARAARDWGAGSTASRLVTGSLPLHEALEEQLAAHKGKESALLFGSGYMANAGIVTALAGRDDRILADRLCHASLIDAAMLSRARLQRFRHNDPDHLAHLLRQPSRGRTLVVVESVYSMDGDRAPLPAIANLAETYGALLLVDEAHATGVLGPRGRGWIVESGCADRVNLSMGTLSKALGSYGGYVACSRLLRDWLIQKARALIYTTAPPPAAVAAAQASLDLLQTHPEWPRELQEAATTLRRHLHAEGLDTGTSESQILPILLGAPQAAMEAARRLQEKGLLLIAMRPPTVPPGTSRLRLSLSRAHQTEDFAGIARTIAEACTAAARETSVHA